MGFRSRLTLLEFSLLVVLVAIAAWIGTGQYQSAQRRELLEIMQDDLRNLKMAQEAYAADNGGLFMPYSVVTTANHQYGYAPSSGVTVEISEPSASGWSATATHVNAPGTVCGIFIGELPLGSPNPATESSQPACE
ncbi:MAG: hypothetical protein ABIV11_06325 [Gemmatimonadaceae bacterium]